jgi:hypothetical protein
MPKKPGLAELPDIFARPIITSEIDPALFVKARAVLPDSASPEEVEARAVWLEQARRMFLLARHLKIDVAGGESWFGVARWLAEKFDPAFRVLDTAPRRAGRPGKVAWRDLCNMVQGLVAGGLKVKAACGRVAKESGVDPETLRRMCYRSKRKSGRAAAPIIKSEIDPAVVDLARRDLPGTAGAAEARERAADLLQAFGLFDLAEALGLDWESESHWLLLSLWLAENHLPGLRRAAPVPVADHADLVAAVKKKRGDAARRTSWACQQWWSKDQKWQEKHKSKAAMETAFYAAERKRALKLDYGPFAGAAYFGLLESAGGLDGYIALLFQSEEPPLHSAIRQAIAALEQDIAALQQDISRCD